jgi:hypothetical protein
MSFQRIWAPAPSETKRGPCTKKAGRKLRLAWDTPVDQRPFFSRFSAFFSLAVFNGAFLVSFLESCDFDMFFLG